MASKEAARSRGQDFYSVLRSSLNGRYFFLLLLPTEYAHACYVGLVRSQSGLVWSGTESVVPERAKIRREHGACFADSKQLTDWRGNAPKPAPTNGACQFGVWLGRPLTNHRRRRTPRCACDPASARARSCATSRRTKDSHQPPRLAANRLCRKHLWPVKETKPTEIPTKYGNPPV